MEIKQVKPQEPTKLNSVTDLEKPVNHDAIRVLENTLSRVRDGEITALCLAYVQSDKTISGDWSTGNDSVRQWAAIKHVERTFYRKNIETTN